MFRTELPIAPATGQLPRTARVLTLGSCFADSIGSRLVAHKVETLVNPFGTVFQPLALGRLLRAAAGEEVDWQQHLVEARGRWQSYDLHGSIGASSPVDLLQSIRELVRRTGEFLRQADVVLLTLGTAWAYRLRETGELVNNCHKQPADLFVRELLTPDEVINNLAETHAYLRRINPNLRFVLTVSPVRHLKDTLPLNSVSKSVLRVATHILSDLLPGVAYFPAYELLMDDLRDYRFYAADMLHPSEVAEDYIWDKFARTYFDTEFGRFRKEWNAVRNSLAHRPLHAGAPEHRQFLENTLEKLEQFSLRKVTVDAELQEVRTKLAALPVPQQPVPMEMPEDDEERIDIGEASPTAASTSALSQDDSPAATGERAARLSPEEFRAQRAARSERGRRDGRGKGQTRVPAENEQFQASTRAVDQAEILSAPTAELSPMQLETAEDLLEASATSAVSGLAEAAGVEEPTKKKKRRSRGGAKRTARKHALRLAAGEVNPEEEAAPESESAAELTAETDSTDIQPVGKPENKKSSVITKSVPVKRGGRRDESRSVPRVALFAPAVDAPLPADAESPQAEPTLPPVETPGIIAEVAASAPDAAKSRNSRNRGRKATTPEDGASRTEAAEPTPVLETGRVEQPSGPAAAADFSARNARDEQPLPVGQASAPAGGEETPGGAEKPTPGPARRSNRAKRAVSGARAEKPAIDVPVVPVPDATKVRTQVAAGRMTGSSATLIEPAAESASASPKKKTATPKKAATPQKPAPKAKTAKKAAEPTPPLPEAPATAPTPKRKPAAKPKAAPAKPAAAKPKAPKKPAKPAK
jgi:hypothetical protein